MYNVNFGAHKSLQKAELDGGEQQLGKSPSLHIGGKMLLLCKSSPVQLPTSAFLEKVNPGIPERHNNRGLIQPFPCSVAKVTAQE